MILKELNLIGFGKYENRVIKLKQGINIIYGENETGKTTIHSFIDGMFYGFLKPSVKSTIYLDEHKRFEPWDAKKYAGIIKFYHKDIEYRIEREFTKGKEETKVLIENTGEEITTKIDNGTKNRILQPGFHFFGFNSRLYSNTVSIKQLATITEEKLADEVRDKLINITTSLDEEISIDNAIKDLDKKLKEIGTARAGNSPYGRTNSKINELEEKKQRILDLKHEYEKLLKDENTLNNQIEATQKNLANQKLELSKAKYNEKKKIYNEAMEIMRSIKILELKINELKIYKNLSNEDYNKANDLSNNINIIEANILYINDQINELQTEVEKMNDGTIGVAQNTLDEISNDYFAYEDMEETKNKLIYGQDNTFLEILRIDMDNNTSKKNLNLIFLCTISAIYLVSTYLAIGTWKFIFLAQLFILPIIILVKRLGSLKSINNNLQIQIQDIQQQDIEKKEQLLNIEKHQKHILEKYKLTSKIELRQIYDNLKQGIYKRNEDVEIVKQHKNKIELLIKKALNLTDDKEYKSKELRSILDKNSVNDLLSFHSGLANKELHDDYLVDRNNKKDLIKRILGNFTLEQIRFELDSNKNYESIEVLPMEFINSKIEEYQKVLSQDLIERRGLEERINNIGPKISRLVEIEEELIRSKVMLNEYDMNIESIQLAKLTIEDLSKDIHNQFAPEINKMVGNIVSKITGGKYNSVRIDNSLEIGVINPNTGQIIEIDSLSGGTIDQLYFSLRFGIINSMVESNLPLILDDCFIQYDDSRLENILRFLSDICKDRQIILFSCHNRERKILKDMDVSFNLITLS